MSENMKRRLAVLEAFAQSKPTEFDAFVLRWEKANPLLETKLEKASTIIEEPTRLVEETPSKVHRKKLEFSKNSEKGD